MASEDEDSGSQPEPFSPSNIAEAVQFQLDKQFTNIKFRNRSDNATDTPPLAPEKLSEPQFPPELVLTTIGDRYEQTVFSDIVQYASLVRIWNDTTDAFRLDTHPDAITDLGGTESNPDPDINVFVETIEQVADGDVDGPAVFIHPELEGTIGSFPVTGEADLIIAWPLDDSDQNTADVHIRAFDVKAGEEKPHHQVQASIYACLIDDILATRTDVESDLSAGIIDGDTPVNTLVRSELPSFNYRSRRQDLEQLLSKNGFFHQVFKRTDTPPHELGKAADESGYGEYIYAQAIEERDIRLLGLSIPEQQAYRNQGVETLEDVAALIDEIPDKPRPYDELPELNPRYADVVQELNGDPQVSEQVQLTAQRAQVLLGRLNPSHPSANESASQDGAWLQGSGKADLPEDNPHESWDTSTFNIPVNSLIRVYVDVQMDYLNDRVLMLNAFIDCGQADENMQVSKLVEEVPDPETDDADNEATVVGDFVGELFTKMKIIAGYHAGLDLDETSVHFYFHTEGERQVFADALRRQDSNDKCRILRDLLDLRAGINDQETDQVEQLMVSLIQPAIKNHYALSDLGYGVPNIHRQLKYYQQDFWRQLRDGQNFLLDRMFSYETLTRTAEYTRAADDTLTFVADTCSGDDDYYPSMPRHQIQLPLAYFWAAEGIDVPYEEWRDTELGFSGLANRFVYLDPSQDQQTTRVKREDVKEFGKRLAHALRDIERNLNYIREPINTGRTEKHPLPLEPGNLAELLEQRKPPTLADGCLNAVDFEHEAAAKKIENRRDQPVLEGLRMGDAMPVIVTDISPTGSDSFYARPAFDAPELEKEDSEFLKQANRVGDFVTATKVTTESGELAVDTDWEAENPPRLRINEIDWENDSIHMTDYGKMWHRDDPYNGNFASVTFNTPATGNYQVSIENGDFLLLEDSDSTIGRARARTALQGIDGNGLYDLLERVRTEEYSPRDLTTAAFDNEDVDEFLADLNEVAGAVDGDDLIAPNAKQEAFIRKTTARLSLLQGPPGTGKTTGTLAPTVLSRASTRVANDGPFHALVTAPTHSAIDEVLQETDTLLGHCCSKDIGDVEDVQLVRLDEASQSPDSERITQIDTRNDTQWITQNLWPSTEDRDYPFDGTGSDTPVIVFATPQSVHKLLTNTHARGDDQDSYRHAPGLFQFMAVDEASMLTLPQLFMASPLITADSQIVVAGDHRQMPPVQQYDWGNEDRLQTINTGAFLSTLNFCRFLHGEEIERLERHDHFEAVSPDADTIEMTRLNTSYRCHRTVTEFLRRWMYDQDGIDYCSTEDTTLTTATGDVAPSLAPVFEEAPLILITHDDKGSQQQNVTEASLVSQITELLPDDESVGVVSPHNAQKALINSMTDDNTDVDTVERFQGNERDAILVSATVSDPAYLDLESDFILNPNRLNVALSRMRKKLIVVAPESLFRMIPGNKHTYEDAQIWKGLYHTATDSGIDTTGEVDATGVEYQVYRFDGYTDG